MITRHHSFRRYFCSEVIKKYVSNLKTLVLHNLGSELNGFQNLNYISHGVEFCVMPLKFASSFYISKYDTRLKTICRYYTMIWNDDSISIRFLKSIILFESQLKTCQLG